LGYFRDGSSFKYVMDFKRQSHLEKPRDKHNREDTIASHMEEIALCVDVHSIQQLGHNFTHGTRNFTAA